MLGEIEVSRRMTVYICIFIENLQKHFFQQVCMTMRKYLHHSLIQYQPEIQYRSKKTNKFAINLNSKKFALQSLQNLDLEKNILQTF